MMDNLLSWTATIILVADWLLRLGLAVRIIMRRMPVGVALAWLIMVLSFPLVGAVLYLVFGELRLGRRRALRAAQIHDTYEGWLAELQGRCPADWDTLGPECRPLARLIEANVGIPALCGNRLQLLAGAEEFFPALIADIDAARRTCHLEFYIWNAGGKADEVAEALLRAARRGVVCRLLVDGVGSRPFLHSALIKRLRKGGTDVRVALPVSPIRLLFVRYDLRLHRKIVVIDGQVGFTGSLNLVDPAFFKQGKGLGQWIDAMVRMEGPSVEALGVTFLEDWELETGEGIEKLRETGDAHSVPPKGDATVQVTPSGPATARDAIQKIVLMALHAARRELVLTTPYFVPDEALLTALTTAASRGVEVTLIVPARVDSRFVHFASRAHQGDLLAAGVRIGLFKGGLLHTKSITVDQEMSLFGSANLDPRSIRLNFEITLAIYDAGFTKSLRELQQMYLGQSQILDESVLRSRTFLERFTENVARLLSPLL